MLHHRVKFLNKSIVIINSPIAAVCELKNDNKPSTVDHKYPLAVRQDESWDI